jgi:hypothetical protein
MKFVEIHMKVLKLWSAVFHKFLVNTSNKIQVLCFWTLSMVSSLTKNHPVYIFLVKDETMDNVQKHNTCINVPSSQTFRSYFEQDHSLQMADWTLGYSLWTFVHPALNILHHCLTIPSLITFWPWNTHNSRWISIAFAAGRIINCRTHHNSLCRQNNKH